MRVLILSFLFLFLFCLNAFSNPVTYLGKSCVRTPRSAMLTRTSGNVHVNGLLVHQSKKTIERPIRDCWVHLNNPMRGKKQMYHFEEHYKGGSGKFNGNYVQFFDEAGVEFDPATKGGTFRGIIGIGLENQDSSRNVYLDVPSWRSLTLPPETSCLYLFILHDYNVNPNFPKMTFKVRSDAYYGYIYQKLYYNNNIGGEWLKKEYNSGNFEHYGSNELSDDMFHKYYPNYPIMN